jgi:hypothetical protein
MYPLDQLYYLGWYGEMERARRLAVKRGHRMAVRGVRGPEGDGWKYVVTPAGPSWSGIKLEEVKA